MGMIEVLGSGQTMSWQLSLLKRYSCPLIGLRSLSPHCHYALLP